jgi:predicted anti-sigma-YlaC factor YlaD
MLYRFGIFLLVWSLAAGCSLKKYAINQVGDLLASEDSVYESDDDIELVGEALPFSLKLVETLITESPRHRGLLLTACRGFTVYSYAFVDFDAEVKADEDLDEARRLRERSRKLYLRAHDYGLRGLEVDYPGIGERLLSEPEAAVGVIEDGKGKKQLPLLYWTAASLGLAISSSKNDASLLARIPEVEALVDRALQLDETWDEGALYELEVTLAGAKGGEVDVEKMKVDYDRALELSGGKRASLYLTYAEAVSVPTQNAVEFHELVNKALAVDPDAHPKLRFANELAHRRARWLEGRIDLLFLEPGSEGAQR